MAPLLLWQRNGVGISAQTFAWLLLWTHVVRTADDSGQAQDQLRHFRRTAAIILRDPVLHQLIATGDGKGNAKLASQIRNLIDKWK